MWYYLVLAVFGMMTVCAASLQCGNGHCVNNTMCCPGEQECCPDVGLCCGKHCCNQGYECCHGSPRCCKSSFSCCGDNLCCPDDTTCCPNKKHCCPKGYTCCDQTNGCCPEKSHCCGKYCCAENMMCCPNSTGCYSQGFYCCGNGLACRNGVECCGDECCSLGYKCCGAHCCKEGTQCCGDTCCNPTSRAPKSLPTTSSSFRTTHAPPQMMTSQSTSQTNTEKDENIRVDVIVNVTERYRASNPSSNLSEVIVPLVVVGVICVIAITMFVIFRMYKSGVDPAARVDGVSSRITAYVHKVKTMVTRAVDKGSKGEGGNM